MERKINVSLSCLIQIQISLYNECVTMKDLIQKRITDYGNIKKKKNILFATCTCTLLNRSQQVVRQDGLRVEDTVPQLEKLVTFNK